jgi:hypothetical protein
VQFWCAWQHRAGYFSRPRRILLSGSPLVVMMQATQNRNAPQLNSGGGLAGIVIQQLTPDAADES